MTELVASLLAGPLTEPLLTASAWPAGWTMDVRTAATVDANSRAMLDLRFDIAEMSFATYLRARFVEDLPLIALPAFTGRRFLASHVGVRPGSPFVGRGLTGLRGARVAVPQYWMTSSVWHRSLLRFHEVDPSEVTWVTTTDERFIAPVNGVRVERFDDGRDAAQIVRDGDADALLSPRPRPADLAGVFRNDDLVDAAYHRTTGVFPVMHLVVVHAERVAARPDVLAGVWDALLDARKAATTGAAWPYGLEDNRATLHAMLSTAESDGLLPRTPRGEDVFAGLPADRRISDFERQTV